MDGGGDWRRRFPGYYRRCLSDPADVAAAGACRHASGVRRYFASCRSRAAPVPPPLGLNTIDREGQLQISWDRTSPAVQHASDALLEINEGGPKPTAIQLDAAHLQTGSFTYARTAEKVDVKLIVHQAKRAGFSRGHQLSGQTPRAQAGGRSEGPAAARGNGQAGGQVEGRSDFSSGENQKTGKGRQVDARRNAPAAAATAEQPGWRQVGPAILPRPYGCPTLPGASSGRR